MKILTQSARGMVLELNETEFRELSRLILSVEGKTLNETYHNEFNRSPMTAYEEIDLTTVFGAIEAFYSQKFRLNEFERGMKILRASLEMR